MALVGALFIGFAAFVTPLLASAPIVWVIDTQPPPADVRILVGGDMMFDRSVRRYARERGDDHLFSCIEKILQGHDLILANLEGPITAYPSESEGSTVGGPGNVTFTFPTSTAMLLARKGITLVNLGNNHILNFGREGLQQTKYWLQRSGVQYIGDPYAGEGDRVSRITIRGVPLSFVNWNEWASITPEDTAAHIAKERAAGRVVVLYAHWGDEYVPPPPRVKALARQFAESGAAVVIGSHPHVVQEHETILTRDGRSVPVYYSLGNFIFDQYFSEDVRNGLLLRVLLTTSGVSAIEEIPIYLERDRRTCLKPVEN